MHKLTFFSSGSFHMEILPGDFTDSEIIVMLGENGTGKTTFIRMMAGLLKPDEDGRMLLKHIWFRAVWFRLFPKTVTVYAIYFASLIFRESRLQDIFASG